MASKKEIEKAIKNRIKRFNNLWKKEVGHTFEEDQIIENNSYQEHMAEWQPKADARAKELGYQNEMDYFNYINDNNIPFNDVDMQMKLLWEEKPKYPDGLYVYEMSVINEAENIAYWFMDTYHRKAKQKWEEFAKQANHSNYGFIEIIKKEGYDKWFEGHSGNSGAQAILFAFTLLFQTELFPYLHGACASIVGDKGYHDDRIDAQEAIKKYKEKTQTQSTL